MKIITVEHDKRQSTNLFLLRSQRDLYSSKRVNASAFVRSLYSSSHFRLNSKTSREETDRLETSHCDLFSSRKMVVHVGGLVAVLIFFVLILLVGISTGRKQKSSEKSPDTEEIDARRKKHCLPSRPFHHDSHVARRGVHQRNRRTSLFHRSLDLSSSVRLCDQSHRRWTSLCSADARSR